LRFQRDEIFVDNFSFELGTWKIFNCDSVRIKTENIKVLMKDKVQIFFLLHFQKFIHFFIKNIFLGILHKLTLAKKNYLLPVLPKWEGGKFLLSFFSLLTEKKYSSFICQKIFEQNYSPFPFGAN